MQSPLWINVGNDSDYSDMTSRTDLHQATSSSEQRWDSQLSGTVVDGSDPSLLVQDRLVPIGAGTLTPQLQLRSCTVPPFPSLPHLGPATIHHQTYQPQAILRNNYPLLRFQVHPSGLSRNHFPRGSQYSADSLLTSSSALSSFSSTSDESCLRSPDISGPYAQPTHTAESSPMYVNTGVFTLEPESVSELDPAMTLEEALAIADGYQPCKLRDPVIKNTHYRHDRPSYQSPSLYSRVWTLSPSPLSVEFPQTSVVTTRVSEHIELRQEPYTKGIKARLINAEPLSVHVGAPEIGCRLDLLLEKKYEEAGMPDHAALAFPGAEFGQKMSFRFLFCNYPQYNGRQVNVCGTVQGVPQQPTKGHLATLAAREMVKQYIPKHPVSRFPYNEYQISLYAIDMPSKGTLQPRFQCIL